MTVFKLLAHIQMHTCTAQSTLEYTLPLVVNLKQP